jgi:DNA-binding Xre family transcriptional regulator
MATGRDIKNRVPELLQECGAGPMDLVRQVGLAQGTAYKLADSNGDMKAITFETAAALCEFFSRRLGRKVGPGDLFSYEPEVVAAS